MDISKKKFLVTGGAGFLGRHVIGALRARGVPPERIVIPRSHDYDLREQRDCEKAVAGCNIVIHLAAKVGGIGLNQMKPGELFYDNIVMGARMMDAAYRAGVEKFVAVGTVCAYPKYTPVPFREDELWNGYPEETNAPYGLAKKALLIQAQAYRSQYGWNAIYLLPVNLYGPGDSFNPDRSHVIPALIKKVADAALGGARHIDLWGTGKATREFLYVEDAARGITLAAMNYDKPDPINLGSGMEISIKDLIQKICVLMNWHGEIRWDVSKPDGQPRRLLDTRRAKEEFGFEATTNFSEGLTRTIQWYLHHDSRGNV